MSQSYQPFWMLPQDAGLEAVVSAKCFGTGTRVWCRVQGFCASNALRTSYMYTYVYIYIHTHTPQEIRYFSLRGFQEGASVLETPGICWFADLLFKRSGRPGCPNLGLFAGGTLRLINGTHWRQLDQHNFLKRWKKGKNKVIKKGKGKKAR